MINYVYGKSYNGSDKDDCIKIKQPIEIFITDFDDIAIKEFQEDFNECLAIGQQIIPIYIDSPGGEVTSVFGMIDIIKSCPTPVATIAMGFCASAGTLLLSAGTEGYRYASPLAQIMLHDLSAGVYGKEEEIKSYTKYLEKIQDLIYGIYDDNCNQDKGSFKKIIKKTRNLDMYINAAKAKEINLVNHIQIPKFVYEVKTNMYVESIIEKE